MHFWGDKWFEKYGDDLYEAIKKLEYRMRKYGHVKVCGKEKFGTYRDEYLRFWNGGIYGYKIVNIPHWVYVINHGLIKGKETKFGRITYGLCDLTRVIGLTKLVHKFQARGINKAFQITLKEYPHLLDELTSCIDCYECIKPCRWGDVDGVEIHNRHWTKL